MEDSENGTQTCGCKGIRVCLLCENSERARQLRISAPDYSEYQTYMYVCPETRTAVRIPSSTTPYSAEQLKLMEKLKRSDLQESPSYKPGHSFVCDDLILLNDFVTEEEEAELVRKIDESPWLLSQSGRRKQDYGPKVNFKHKKLKLDHYIGMPEYSKRLLAGMCERSTALADYVPFELCNLEYDPERRSCIDFHVDDTWIWGERLITINLLAGSVMSMIDDVSDPKRLLYLLMPRRSLLCMAGRMRYEWKHGIFAEHIDRRRIALTMREPSEAFQENGELYEKYGRTLIERASNYV